MRPSEVERIKLTANLLNSVASGTVLAALVAPFVGLGLGTLQTVNPLNIAGLSVFGIVFAAVVHLIARQRLRRLDGAE